MIWDYAESVFQLLADLAALVFCLFCFISNRCREWLFGLLFFLCGMLSCYYWTTYLVIMGTWPNAFDLMTYSGWGLAYLFLFLLLRCVQAPEEKRFFHPLMLLPVLVDCALVLTALFVPEARNEVRLMLSGRIEYFLSNIYLIIICTVIGISSIQSMCWYRRRRAGIPWIALGVFWTDLTSFAMWIATDPSAPTSVLYYPFSFLSSMSYLVLVWHIRRAVGRERKEAVSAEERKTQNILKGASLGIVLTLSFGGVLLGLWIRNMIAAYTAASEPVDIYDIVPIILFVISLILIAFVISIIFIVNFRQRAAENSRLREAQQIAERSNAAKSEFLAAMSHEIRTPINAMLGMNEIVLRESGQARSRLPADGEETRSLFGDIFGYAEIIHTAGENLLSIVNDILDFSRIESGKMEIRNDGYSLRSVLNDVCSLIAFRAKMRELSFRIDVEERLPDGLYGDAVRVRQILMNILNNAVKYTNAGSVTLSVRADADAVFRKNGRMNLIFSVRDTGIGIRPEDMDRIFNRFERVSRGESGNVEGSGLGLAITRNLLDLMGGTIRTESVYGEGSEFTVTIPQGILSEDPIGRFQGSFDENAGAEKASRAVFRAPEARVLVVDDTRINQNVVRGLLKETAVRIETADSGEEALSLTRSSPFDLILMDRRMPEMDGRETLRRIRSREEGTHQHTPVICMTADAGVESKKRYLEEGFTDYLSKPIDVRDLLEKLTEYLPQEKILRSAGESEEEPEPLPSDPDGFLAGLGDRGIDTAQGLKYCSQDRRLYRSLLSEFAAEAPERIGQMEKSFSGGAWEDYRILVHSLKSVSGTIGAVRLSEAAAAMEKAAEEKDAETLRCGHIPLLNLYRQIADAVRILPADGEVSPAAEEVSPAAEEDVLEFMPADASGSRAGSI